MKRILLLWALCMMVFSYAEAQNIPKSYTDFIKQRATHGTRIHTSAQLATLRENVLMQRLDSIVFASWDEDFNTYYTYYKNEYNYDANSRSLTDINYEWDNAVSAYIPEDKVEYTFNTSNQVVLIIVYNFVSGAYTPDRKMEYTYNTDGSKYYEINYYWDNTLGTWKNMNKIFYEYDGNGNNTIIDIRSWNDASSNWVLDNRYTYTYDANNNKILGLGEVYNSGVWNSFYKMEYSYNISNKLIQELHYNWNTILNVWDASEKYVYVRDANGNESEVEMFSWDNTTMQFVPNNKNIFSYNMSYNVNDIIFSPFFKEEYEFTNVNMITSVLLQYYDATTSSYALDTRVTFHYSAHDITSIFENDAAAQVSVYPHPSSDQIQFGITDMNDVLQVQIYDMQGKLVLNEQINADEKISISDLQNGVYMCKISANEKIMTSKLIKQ